MGISWVYSGYSGYIVGERGHAIVIKAGTEAKIKLQAKCIGIIFWVNLGYAFLRNEKNNNILS